jgi:hypothetical protein
MTQNFTAGCTSQSLPMPNPARLMSAEAEAAIAEITSRLMDHRRLVQLDATRSLARGRGVGRPSRARHGNALVDLVAVAESFASARLMIMRPSVTYDDLSTWRKREKAWERHCSLKLTSYAQWSELKGFVEVRNALQHGLGRLTDQQLGKYRDEILSEICASAVHRDGDFLIVLTDDVGRCGKICAGFVRWLDASVPAA